MSPRTKVGEAGSGISLSASVEMSDCQGYCFDLGHLAFRTAKESVSVILFLSQPVCANLLWQPPRKLAGVNMGQIKNYSHPFLSVCNLIHAFYLVGQNISLYSYATVENTF